MSKKNRERMIFVHLDIADEEHANVLDFFGIKSEQCPTFVIFEMESSAKFLPPAEKAKEISASNMGGFVNDYFDGKLQKSIKSAELPADWDANPVKVLVTTNFEEVAMDKTKDVFVEFYAPWCGKLCPSLNFKLFIYTEVSNYIIIIPTSQVIASHWPLYGTKLPKSMRIRKTLSLPRLMVQKTK